MGKDKLTDKQELFCREYIVDLNAKQAAIRAGYSEKTANEQASRLLTYVNVQEFITSLKKDRSERVKVDQDWVLKRFIEISDRCMQAVPVMIREGRHIVQKTDEEGEGVWEFDSSGANKATEMIAKHIGFFEKDNEQGNKIILPPNNVILNKSNIKP